MLGLLKYTRGDWPTVFGWSERPCTNGTGAFGVLLLDPSELVSAKGVLWCELGHYQNPISTHVGSNGDYGVVSLGGECTNFCPYRGEVDAPLKWAGD